MKRGLKIHDYDHKQKLLIENHVGVSKYVNYGHG